VMAVAEEAGLRSRRPSGPDVGGLTGFVEGRIRRGSGLATADLAIRKVAAVEALSRYGKAKAALLGSVAVEPTSGPPRP